ncbi:MAG: hypothetical protein IV100_16730 [Myxococcales bacterium]|nr:hypothetical protein [Myxococcales bacterium]
MTVVRISRLDNHACFPWLNVTVIGLAVTSDYALVVESVRPDKLKTAVLLIDMKSKHTGGARGQIGNGFLLIDWLLAMARRRNGARGEVKFRGIVFAEKIPGRGARETWCASSGVP